MELSPRALQAVLSDPHHRWEAQANVEGPPLDSDEVIIKAIAPSGNMCEVLQGCVSQNHSSAPSFWLSMLQVTLCTRKHTEVHRRFKAQPPIFLILSLPHFFMQTLIICILPHQNDTSAVNNWKMLQIRIWA